MIDFFCFVLICQLLVNIVFSLSLMRALLVLYSEGQTSASDSISRLSHWSGRLIEVRDCSIDSLIYDLNRSVTGVNSINTVENVDYTQTHIDTQGKF